MWDQSLSELFKSGGPVMWPLLAASVIGLTLMLDRTVAFLWWYESFPRLVKKLRPLVSGREWIRAKQECRRSAPLAHLARVYLEQRQQTTRVREDILKREGIFWQSRLEARLRALGVVAQVSTLLGLLGSVTGLITIFHQVQVVQSLGGQVQPSDMAGGIWAKLLTTTFGLVIAIPCLAAYHLFEGRVDTLSRQMAALVSYLDEWIREAGQATTSLNGAAGAGHELPDDGRVLPEKVSE